MMRAILVGTLILVACGSPPRKAAPRPATVTPVAAPTAAPKLWPVPMRVMTWTPTGAQQIGELPDAPPAVAPATPWFVEPARDLDAAAFDRVVAALQRGGIPGLSLRGQPLPLTPARLAALGELGALEALVLDDTALDPAALDGLRPLRRLYLARTAVDDAALARIAARMPALEVLHVAGTAIGDAGARAVASLRELVALDVSDTRLTDAGGAALGALGKLQVLDLHGTAIGARTIAAIRPLALRELYLRSTRAGAEIATLAGYAPGIARFDASSLAAYRPTDADLAWLATAPELVEVGLENARIHDRLALAIAAAPKLRELHLGNTQISAAAVAAISTRTLLEELDLAGTPVDDARAAAMLAFPNLRMLRLDGTPITDAALRATPGPHLAELFLSKTAVGDAGLAILDHTPKLRALGLGETKVGDATLARIAKLSDLRTLVLSRTTAAREAIDKLGALRELERLYVSETRAGDSLIDALAPCRDLRVLHLANTDVSEHALPTLRGFTRLEELTLGDTRMQPEIVDALAAWPRLHTLSLVGLGLDDTALARLAAHRNLRIVDVSATELRDPSPLAALPDLRVLGVAQTRLSPAGRAALEALAARGVEIVR
ncbi:MAG: hypothetical protein KF773_09960 [Deltaproteobacteria bacterium]|nr:hypothetical protein [Deltaproteobacteria bacterium]